MESIEFITNVFKWISTIFFNDDFWLEILVGIKRGFNRTDKALNIFF